MHSGEARVYLDTLENILHDMSMQVVPENKVDNVVQKLLYSFIWRAESENNTFC